MCGRFALSAPQAELMPHLGVDEAPQFAARYNITPTQHNLVVAHSWQQAAGGGEVVAVK